MFPLKLNAEGRLIEALPSANLALNINISEEVHLYSSNARALTRLTAPSFNIEAESTRFKSISFRFREHGIDGSNLIPEFGVSRRIASRRSTNRALVDVHTLVKMLEAIYSLARYRSPFRLIELLGSGGM
jgi:hypothetical protein